MCLLFVEPILNAFNQVTTTESESDAETGPRNKQQQPQQPRSELRKDDAFYFLITLACSSNLGSALTYTGNPQNMIIAQDAIAVCPPHQFLAYMLVPAISTWYLLYNYSMYYYCTSSDFM